MIQCADTDLAALRSMPVHPRIGNAIEVLAGGQVRSQVMGLLVPKGMFELGIVIARRAVHFGQLVEFSLFNFGVGFIKVMRIGCERRFAMADDCDP